MREYLKVTRRHSGIPKMSRHGKNQRVEGWTYLYFAVRNSAAKDGKQWTISFQYYGKVRNNHRAIREAEYRIMFDHGDSLVHIWAYDQRISQRWIGQFLTERQIKAHLGLEIPPRFLRGESSPKMTDYLNDRGGE